MNETLNVKIKVDTSQVKTNIGQVKNQFTGISQQTQQTSKDFTNMSNNINKSINNLTFVSMINSIQTMCKEIRKISRESTKEITNFTSRANKGISVFAKATANEFGLMGHFIRKETVDWGRAFRDGFRDGKFEGEKFFGRIGWGFAYAKESSEYALKGIHRYTETIKVGTKIIGKIGVEEFKNIGRTGVQAFKDIAAVIKNTCIPYIMKFLSVVAVFKTIKDLAKNAVNVAKTGDEIKDESQKVHMSTAAYQEWGYVLEQNGASIKNLKTAMRTFQGNITSNSDALKKYGITAKEMDKAFEQAVFNIQNLGSETEKTAALTALFGNRATELMAVMNLTNGQTRNLMSTYRAIGATMSNELITMSDNLTDSILAMKKAWQGLKNTLATVVIPVVQRVVNVLTVAIGAVNLFLKALFNIKETFGKKKTSQSNPSGLGSNLTENLNNAADTAEKIKKTIASFDELNVLDSKDTGGGAGGAGGSIGGDFGDMEGGLFDGIISDETLAKLDKIREFIDKYQQQIQIITPLLMVAAGLALIFFGHPVAGIALAGLGIAIGTANGAWETLYDTIKGVCDKVQGPLMVAAGLGIALIGALTANIPLFVAGAGMAALGVKIANDNDQWSNFIDVIKNIPNKIKGYALQATGFALMVFGAITANLPLLLVGAGLAAVGITITNTEDGFWSNKIESLKNALDSIKTAVSTWWDNHMGKYFTKEFWTSKWNSIKDSIGNIKDNLSGIFSNVKDGATNAVINIKAKWSDTKEKITKKFKDIYGSIKDKTIKFKAKVATTKDKLMKEWNKLVSDVKKADGLKMKCKVVVDTAKSNIQKIWDDYIAKTKIGTAVVSLKVKITSKWEDIKAEWETLLNKANGAKIKMNAYISTKWDEIKDDWNTLKSKFTSNPVGVKIKIPTWSSLKTTWNNLLAKFKGKTVSIKMSITATVSNIKSWINTSIIDQINNKLHQVKLLKNISIPRLARGGILTEPTIAELGEYAGAKNNPEIAAPQSLLTEIVNKGNDELSDVMIQIGKQVIRAIENNEMTVSIGDETIAKAAQRGNSSYAKRTGKPLFSY